MLDGRRNGKRKDDRNIVIKKKIMDSCVTTWDDNDYVTEVEKELSNTDINKQVTFKEKLCVS